MHQTAHRIRHYTFAFAVAIAGGLCPPGAPALPVISEVLYDQAGADGGGVFTELYGPAGTSLDGWTLVGVNGRDGVAYRAVDLSGATFPADGILVLATAGADPALAAQRDLVAAVDWQNGPDALRLLDAGGDLVDALQYGEAGRFDSGEGTPAEDVAPGYSLARDAYGTDTGDNARDFLPLAAPTPGGGLQVAGASSGSPRAASVPAPATASLLAAGLLPLLRIRRPLARSSPAGCL